MRTASRPVILPGDSSSARFKAPAISWCSPPRCVTCTLRIRGSSLPMCVPPADPLWEHNPHITRLSEGPADVESLDMHYPLVHQSNNRPYHFLHGYVQFLEEKLGLRIPLTQFSGDIHLSDQEKRSSLPLGIPERFWILIAGGKYNFTAKWWNPAAYQAVVDHFQGRIAFVRCGEKGHWHPPLQGVIDLVGRPSSGSSCV